MAMPSNNRWWAAVLLFAGTALAYTFRQDNARTGFSIEPVALPLNRTATVSLNAPVLSSPCVVGDTVYIGARDSSIYCLHRGTILWRFRTRGWVDATPAWYQGRIYAGSRDGLMYILDPATGDSLGAIFNGSAQCASPLVFDSLAVFGAGGWAQDIRAQNIRGGDENIWFHTNRQMVYSSAALGDSLVVYGENGGSLTALHAYTGRPVWKYQTRGGVYLSSPAISDGTVYFSPGEYDKNIYAFSLADGKLLWSSAPDEESLAKPADRHLVNMLLRYQPSTRGIILEKYRRLHKMKKADVKALAPLLQSGASASGFVALGGNATSSVAAGRTNVFVARMEYGWPRPRFTITAFDRHTGYRQWSFSELRDCEQLGFCSSPLVVADSIVLAGWGEGKFYAFDAKSGAVMWEDSLEGDILSSPAAAGGKVFVATTLGKVVTYSSASANDGPSGGYNFQDSTYCYPNPARGDVSRIRICVPGAADATLIIYSSAERPVVHRKWTLNAANEYTHTYDWGLGNVANGVYFARVKVKYRGDGSEDEKVLKIGILR